MSAFDLSPERAVMALPCVQAYERASDNAFVTPMIGKIASQQEVTEAFLGDDGLTPAEYPSLLERRGFFFDGSEWINCGNNAIFSFASAGGDLPFSFACLLRPDETNGTTSIAGLSASGDAAHREWYAINNSGDLYFRCFDAGGDIVGRSASDVFAGIASPDLIVPVVFTYDGSEANGGFKIYANNERVDDANAGAGVYGGMSALGGNLLIGDENTKEWIGDIVCPVLYDFEVQPEDIAELTRMLIRWSEIR